MSMGGRARTGCWLIWMAAGCSPAQDWDGPSSEIAAVASTVEATLEETFKSHNDRLNALFRAWVRRRGGPASAEDVRAFNAAVRSCGMTTFDDFLKAETRPLRYRRDPVSGDRVPVLGALGSDLINPWLITAGIVDGRPLEQQPMYEAAACALREHTDFALIGMRDPNLSLDLVPPELRPNARLAYRRLNPGGAYDGGFDHPLFYATLREAARKLFREDYPKAKLTMDELVVPEAKGGFGIQSCLLCHGRNPSDVYKRLLGQGLYHQSKVTEWPEGSAEARENRESASIYLRAAQTVIETCPGEIDAGKVRDSLALVAPENTDRLKPGFEEFYATLDRMGCMKCHREGSTPPEGRNPAKYGAFVLNPNSYHKTENIKALSSVIDLHNPERSKILLKAAAKVKHGGAKDVTLDESQVEILRVALIKWVQSFLPKRP